MLYDIEGVWATWFSGLKRGPIQAQSRFLQCFVPLSGGTHISFIAALLSFLPRLYYLASTPPGNKLYRPGIVGFASMFVGAVPAEGSNELAFTWLPQSIPQSPPGPLNWATLRPTRPGLRASLNTASPSHCGNLHQSHRYLSAQKPSQPCHSQMPAAAYVYC